MAKKELTVIGNNTLVDIAGIKNVPAKIDTGADSSSVWASNIKVNADDQLEFVLFAPSSKFYTGERLTTKEFGASQVRNSTGDYSVRYTVTLSIKIKNRKIRAKFTLADRSRNRFPILIGRKTLQNKFLVDVSRIAIPRPPASVSNQLTAELAQSPRRFHQKYMDKN